MAQESLTKPGDGQSPSPAKASLSTALVNLPNSLAFFQFMLVFLPFGFCSFTGTSIPYTNEGFIGALVLLLAGSGPALGVIAFILMKWQRSGAVQEGHGISKEKSILMSVVAYVAAAFAILLFFIEQDGWISDLGPILVYFVGVLISGTLAMMGLMNRRDTSKGSMPGLDLVLALAIIGGMYLIPARFGLPTLLLVDAVIALAIPPLRALPPLGGESSLLAAPEAAKPVAMPFAWCDRFINTGNGPRTWMGTAIMLLIAIPLGNMFNAMLYFNRPFPMYSMHVITFFITTACSTLAFSTIFKQRDATIAFIVVLACNVASMVLGDYLTGFAKNPASLVISGIALGGALSLLFKFQETRKMSLNLKDFSGNRVLETFYYTLIAALYGLLACLTISWEALLGEPSTGYLPARSLIGGMVLAFAIITFSVFTGNARYMRDVEKGVVTRKAESMEELVGGTGKDGSRTSDPMVAAMLGSGASTKKEKVKNQAKPAKSTDPLAAAMLGGAPQKKATELAPKPTIAAPASSPAPAPSPAPLQPASTPAPSALQLPERIRKIKALLMISKRVKIENVREALALDAETCDIVLNTWKSMLGIDVTSEFVDFKDIDTEKILNILEAFLAEWNKP